MSQDCLQQRERGSGVVAEEDFRADHGLAGLNEGCKVEDAVEGITVVFRCREKVFNYGSVRQLTFNKIHAFGQEVAPSVAQVVESNHRVPQFGKKSRDGTTNIPRTTSNQYLHEFTPLPERIGLT